MIALFRHGLRLRPDLRIWHCVVNITMDVPQVVDVNTMCDDGVGVMGAVDFGDVADISENDILRRFFKKDAYNYVDKRRHAKIFDGDANAAIVYLEGKVDADTTSMARTYCGGTQVYGKKEMWANTFLCEKFCAGYRTTSRCEGINLVCKNFLESKHSMLELVQNLELPVRVYRNNELLAQFRSIYSEPVLTTSLDFFKHHTASLYTRAVFGDVKREIESVSSVNFVGVRRSLTMKVYTVEEYGYLGRHIVVLCDKNMGKLECHCNFWKIQGFPCKHIFFVMKHEHMLTIPSSLVLKCWTKEAKLLEAYVEKTDDGGNRVFLLRHGTLHSVSRWLFFLGAQQVGLFAVALEGIHRLCATLESELAKGLHSGNSKACGEVRDPIVVRTKGAPRRHKRNASKRKCSKCNKPGHTKRTCTDGRP
ncbi:hypothetical protein Ahy_A09g044488 [Arachis hypogaea]|uniref:Uncharacterized protein n=1 Tax=Arachis hypogaea TaxID=3818 RepID=A0A445BK66_ARAHY|nr:hypothetical protein Ahy_A09g044488 [Arachis hypogaea]